MRDLKDLEEVMEILEKQASVKQKQQKVSKKKITQPVRQPWLLRVLRWEASGDGTQGYEKVFRVPSPFSLYRNTRSRKGVAAVWQAVELKAPGSWDM